jgi:hypothetical protein
VRAPVFYSEYKKEQEMARGQNKGLRVFPLGWTIARLRRCGLDGTAELIIMSPPDSDIAGHVASEAQTITVFGDDCLKLLRDEIDDFLNGVRPE